MKSDRLQSLDTLRGFDMLWIIGGELLIRTLSEATGAGWLNWLSGQTHHVAWEGFHMYDLIFPLFMFISGVAIPFSLFRRLEGGAHRLKLVRKILIRGVILIALGMAYNGFFSMGFRDLRVASVLGQIGIAYMIAALLAIYLQSPRKLAIALASVILIATTVHIFIPVPGFGAGAFTPEGSINSFIDQRLLPGSMYREHYDPEGLLCVLFASALPLMGVLAGIVLRLEKISRYIKTGILAASGALFVALALLWGGAYPIIKDMWTGTFILLTGGISLLLLALFYLVIDVWQIRGWTLAFRVIGMNSITIYMGVRIVDFYGISDFFFGGLAGLSGQYAGFVLAAGLVLIEWLILFFLYRKKIFLRV